MEIYCVGNLLIANKSFAKDVPIRHMTFCHRYRRARFQRLWDMTISLDQYGNSDPWLLRNCASIHACMGSYITLSHTVV